MRSGESGWVVHEMSCGKSVCIVQAERCVRAKAACCMWKGGECVRCMVLVLKLPDEHKSHRQMGHGFIRPRSSLVKGEDLALHPEHYV